MKKIIAVVLISALLIASVVLGVSAAGRPNLTVSTAVSAPGKTVNLTVTAKNNPGINSFTLGVEYDTTRLELKNVKVASALGGQAMFGTKIVWLGNQDVAYDGEILTLEFQVLPKAANGEARVTLTYSPGDICNYAEEDVNFAIVSGAVTVGEPSIFSRLVLFFRRLFEILFSF